MMLALYMHEQCIDIAVVQGARWKQQGKSTVWEFEVYSCERDNKGCFGTQLWVHKKWAPYIQQVVLIVVLLLRQRQNSVAII
eukprot:8352026-Prorocentrum_lima.AAC.1